MRPEQEYFFIVLHMLKVGGREHTGQNRRDDHVGAAKLLIPDGRLSACVMYDALVGIDRRIGHFALGDKRSPIGQTSHNVGSCSGNDGLAHELAGLGRVRRRGNIPARNFCEAELAKQILDASFLTILGISPAEGLDFAGGNKRG